MSEILSKEQIRIILLHEFKLGRKAVEAHENIVKAWGPDVFSIRSTQLWFQKFGIENGKNGIPQEFYIMSS